MTTDTTEWGYETIKQLARDTGQRPEDLVALSPKNDPFYQGTPSDLTVGKWFADLWNRFGLHMRSEVHIRRVHYQIISQRTTVLLPNRRAFTVDDDSWISAPGHIFKGPRLLKGDRKRGESVRFLGSHLPAQLDDSTTYFVIEVKAADSGTPAAIRVSATPDGLPMVLSPGAGHIAQPYENTDYCWNFLTQASKTARYLDLVDARAFADRRNPAATVYLPDFYEKPLVDTYNGLWDTPRFPDFPELPTYSLSGFAGYQGVAIELVCEKSTINDVLLPIAERYGAVLQTALGELSITATLELIARAKKHGKPVRIFYISDFDPAGRSMPVAIARKVEYYVRSEGLDLDIQLFPLVLTEAQIARFNLPRTPIKETETRAEAFEDRFGAGAVELDALEALYPGELSRIITRALDDYYDHTLGARVDEARTKARRELTRLAEAEREPFAADIAQLTTLHAELRDRFDAEIAEYATRVTALWNTIEQALSDNVPDDEAFTVPTPDDPTERDDALYSTSRGYVDQIHSYKTFQGKTH